MNTTVECEHNPCIVAGVQPLLTELRDPVRIHLHGRHDTGRTPLEGFIYRTFRQTYGAELRDFYPDLAAFTTGGRIRGVVGFRNGLTQPLFSEQYLDTPVEKVMTTHPGHIVERRHVVEVGNLALAGTGEARWVIAAMTVLLQAAGYRWVLFTAVKPLFNAFQRLGLRPVQIAIPDPKRLAGGGNHWGSYYQAGPMVYVGNIEAGYKKLSAHVSQRQPRLHALMREARHLGASNHPVESPVISEAV
jgi:Thermostable hemolysin